MIPLTQYFDMVLVAFMMLLPPTMDTAEVFSPHGSADCKFAVKRGVDT